MSRDRFAMSLSELPVGKQGANIRTNLSPASRKASVNNGLFKLPETDTKRAKPAWMQKLKDQDKHEGCEGKADKAASMSSPVGAASPGKPEWMVKREQVLQVASTTPKSVTEPGETPQRAARGQDNKSQQETSSVGGTESSSGVSSSEDDGIPEWMRRRAQMITLAPEVVVTSHVETNPAKEKEPPPPKPVEGGDKPEWMLQRERLLQNAAPQGAVQVREEAVIRPNTVGSKPEWMAKRPSMKQDASQTKQVQQGPAPQNAGQPEWMQKHDLVGVETTEINGNRPRVQTIHAQEAVNHLDASSEHESKPEWMQKRESVLKVSAKLQEVKPPRESVGGTTAEPGKLGWMLKRERMTKGVCETDSSTHQSPSTGTPQRETVTSAAGTETAFEASKPEWMTKRERMLSTPAGDEEGPDVPTGTKSEQHSAHTGTSPVSVPKPQWMLKGEKIRRLSGTGGTHAEADKPPRSPSPVAAPASASWEKVRRVALGSGVPTRPPKPSSLKLRDAGGKFTEASTRQSTGGKPEWMVKRDSLRSMNPDDGGAADAPVQKQAAVVEARPCQSPEKPEWMVKRDSMRLINAQECGAAEDSAPKQVGAESQSGQSAQKPEWMVKRTSMGLVNADEGGVAEKSAPPQKPVVTTESRPGRGAPQKPEWMVKRDSMRLSDTEEAGAAEETVPAQALVAAAESRPGQTARKPEWLVKRGSMRSINSAEGGTTLDSIPAPRKPPATDSRPIGIAQKPEWLVKRESMGSLMSEASLFHPEASGTNTRVTTTEHPTKRGVAPASCAAQSTGDARRPEWMVKRDSLRALDPDGQQVEMAEAARPVMLALMARKESLRSLPNETEQLESCPGGWSIRSPAGGMTDSSHGLAVRLLSKERLPSCPSFDCQIQSERTTSLRSLARESTLHNSVSACDAGDTPFTVPKLKRTHPTCDTGVGAGSGAEDDGTNNDNADEPAIDQPAVTLGVSCVIEELPITENGKSRERKRTPRHDLEPAVSSSDAVICAASSHQDSAAGDHVRGEPSDETSDNVAKPLTEEHLPLNADQVKAEDIGIVEEPVTGSPTLHTAPEGLVKSIPAAGSDACISSSQLRGALSDLVAESKPGVMPSEQTEPVSVCERHLQSTVGSNGTVHTGETAFLDRAAEGVVKEGRPVDQGVGAVDSPAPSPSPSGGPASISGGSNEDVGASDGPVAHFVFQSQAACLTSAQSPQQDDVRTVNDVCAFSKQDLDAPVEETPREKAVSSAEADNLRFENRATGLGESGPADASTTEAYASEGGASEGSEDCEVLSSSRQEDSAIDSVASNSQGPAILQAFTLDALEGPGDAQPANRIRQDDPAIASVESSGEEEATFPAFATDLDALEGSGDSQLVNNNEEADLAIALVESSSKKPATFHAFTTDGGAFEETRASDLEAGRGEGGPAIGSTESGSKEPATFQAFTTGGGAFEETGGSDLACSSREVSPAIGSVESGSKEPATFQALTTDGGAFEETGVPDLARSSREEGPAMASVKSDSQEPAIFQTFATDGDAWEENLATASIESGSKEQATFQAFTTDGETGGSDDASNSREDDPAILSVEAASREALTADGASTSEAFASNASGLTEIEGHLAGEAQLVQVQPGAQDRLACELQAPEIETRQLGKDSDVGFREGAATSTDTAPDEFDGTWASPAHDAFATLPSHEMHPVDAPAENEAKAVPLSTEEGADTFPPTDASQKVDGGAWNSDSFGTSAVSDTNTATKPAADPMDDFSNVVGWGFSPVEEPADAEALKNGKEETADSQTEKVEENLGSERERAQSERIEFDLESEEIGKQTSEQQRRSPRRRRSSAGGGRRRESLRDKRPSREHGVPEGDAHTAKQPPGTSDPSLLSPKDTSQRSLGYQDVSSPVSGEAVAPTEALQCFLEGSALPMREDDPSGEVTPSPRAQDVSTSRQSSSRAPARTVSSRSHASGGSHGSKSSTGNNSKEPRRRTRDSCHSPKRSRSPSARKDPPRRKQPNNPRQNRRSSAEGRSHRRNSNEQQQNNESRPQRRPSHHDEVKPHRRNANDHHNRRSSHESHADPPHRSHRRNSNEPESKESSRSHRRNSNEPYRESRGGGGNNRRSSTHVDPPKRRRGGKESRAPGRTVSGDSTTLKRSSNHSLGRGSTHRTDSYQNKAAGFSEPIVHSGFNDSWCNDEQEDVFDDDFVVTKAVAPMDFDDFADGDDFSVATFDQQAVDADRRRFQQSKVFMQPVKEASASSNRRSCLGPTEPDQVGLSPTRIHGAMKKIDAAFDLPNASFFPSTDSDEKARAKADLPAFPSSEEFDFFDGFD